MGYELHIVRLDDYNDGEEESKISLEEWLAYVEIDNELELTNGYELNIPGIENTWQEVPGFCNWLGHPKSDAGTLPWFDFSRGSVSAKYPDSHTIKKMIKIANSLNARVHGDDFEYYDETYFTNGGHPIIEPEPETNTNASDEKVIKKPWWKFW